MRRIGSPRAGGSRTGLGEVDRDFGRHRAQAGILVVRPSHRARFRTRERYAGLEHDDFGLNQSKIMNAIDYNN